MYFVYLIVVVAGDSETTEKITFDWEPSDFSAVLL